MTITPAEAELSEAEALFEFETGAGAETVAALGIEATRIAGGVAVSMTADATGFWSKALGFGTTEPVTEDVVAEIAAFYRRTGVKQAMVQVAPSLTPAEWGDWCGRHGITGGQSWVKLTGRVERVAAASFETDGVEARPLDPADAAECGAVMMRAFGLPEEHYGTMATAGGPSRGWHPHALWLDGDLVGAGTVFVQGRCAQMFGGAVLPEARRRGGQSALIAARAKAALELGCEWLVAETGAEDPGTHNSSLHNLRRLGFADLYERRNWIWRPENSASTTSASAGSRSQGESTSALISSNS